ncbi:hypothetical protein RHMOL_Rhmol02G0166100 [Rhododendron molle]|uniref:Uncharacterized protein n=1 Tax=Rhododendron molle TaxID=49168 RepID=A0ACC0PSA7_RHOML|nr:hypothetical protein RHMOL_Rhmol02G0166100 [Rhododendron molle]
MRNQGPGGFGKFSVSEHTIFESKLDELSTKLEKMKLDVIQVKPVKEVNEVRQVEACVICETMGHSTDNCHTIPALRLHYSQLPPKEVCAMNQWVFVGSTSSASGSKSELAATSTSRTATVPCYPRSARIHTIRPVSRPKLVQQQQAPPPRRTLEDTMNTFRHMQITTIEQTAQAMNNIRTQMGKLTMAIGVLQQERGKLPIQPLANPQGQHLIGSSSVPFLEQAKAIISLRSGKTVDNAQVEPPVTPLLFPIPISSKPTTQNGESPKQACTEEEKGKAKESDIPPAFTVPALFPNRLRTPAKPNLNADIYDVFKQVTVNLPLLDAIKQILLYAKFLKDLCTHKRKLQVQKKVFLTEQVSSLFESTLPPKGGGSTRVPKTAKTPAPVGLPSLEWTIGVKGPSGARAVIDIPRLPQPPMRLPAQVPRKWAEKAIMLMVGMRQLLKNCANGRVLQTRPVPEPVSPVAPQVQPRRSTRTQPQDTASSPTSVSVRGRGTQNLSRPSTEVRQFEVLPRAASQRRPIFEDSEEETEESLKSCSLESTDSSTASSSPGDDDDDGDDEVESTKSEGHQRKRTRRD